MSIVTCKNLKKKNIKYKYVKGKFIIGENAFLFQCKKIHPSYTLFHCTYFCEKTSIPCSIHFCHIIKATLLLMFFSINL